MPDLLIRNMPQRIFDRIKQRAVRNRLSLSSESIKLLEKIIDLEDAHDQHLLEQLFDREEERQQHRKAIPGNMKSTLQ